MSVATLYEGVRCGYYGYVQYSVCIFFGGGGRDLRHVLIEDLAGKHQKNGILRASQTFFASSYTGKGVTNPPLAIAGSSSTYSAEFSNYRKDRPDLAYC